MTESHKPAEMTAEELVEAHSRANHAPVELEKSKELRAELLRRLTPAPGPGVAKAAQAITAMIDKWLEKMNLPTSNKEGKQIFTQTIQDIIEQCVPGPAASVDVEGLSDLLFIGDRLKARLSSYPEDVYIGKLWDAKADLLRRELGLEGK